VRLEVVDLVVGGGSAEDETPQYLDITVRNVGTTVSVITGLSLSVREFELFPACENEEVLLPSQVYDGVKLPTETPLGRVVERQG